MRIDGLKVCFLVGAALLARQPAASQAPPAPPAPPAAPAPPTPPRVERDGDQISIGKGRVVAKGEVVNGDLALVGGSLRVAGTVRGDVGLIGGDLILESGAVIEGDVGVAGGNAVLHQGSTIRGELAVKGGEILNHGGRVEGEMRTSDESAGATSTPVANTENQARDPESWFAPIGRALGGILSTAAVGLVLAGAGAALIFYGLPYLQTVSDTVRVSTFRAGAVGLAATFLAIPAFVVLLVVLAVSIVGIPLLIVAAPLYPVAVLAAIALGIVAAAHAVGERTAEQRDPLDLRFRNAYAYLFTGVGVLLAPVVASFLLGMTGFLGFASVLLAILAAIGLWAAATVGLGAVILSRGGTRRVFAERFTPPHWESDPLLDDEPMPANRRA